MDAPGDARPNQPPAAPAEPAATQVERWLCPSCLTPNRPEDLLCVRCRGPIQVLAGTYESALAEGWVFGTAGAKARPDLLHVVVLWFVFLCYLSLVPFLVLDGDPRKVTWWALVFLLVVFGGIFGWLAIRSLGRYLRARSVRPDASSPRARDDPPAETP